MGCPERSADVRDGPGHERGAPSRPIHRLGDLESLSSSGLKGSYDGAGLRLAVACGRFNQQVTERLLGGALAETARRGVREHDVVVVFVPGAFELPLAAAELARTGRVDAVVCLGSVIRGETTHYDFVAGQCASGLQQVQLAARMPIVFGVLTTEDLDQALARSGGSAGDKGAEAVTTAIEMVHVLKQVGEIALPARVPGRP